METVQFNRGDFSTNWIHFAPWGAWIIIILILHFFLGGGGRGLAKRDSIENPLNDIGYFSLTISVDKLFFKAGQTSI